MRARHLPNAAPGQCCTRSVRVLGHHLRDRVFLVRPDLIVLVELHDRLRCVRDGSFLLVVLLVARILDGLADDEDGCSRTEYFGDVFF